MNNHEPDRFFIGKLYPGQKPPGDSIMWGSLDAVMERIIDSNARNQALDLLRDARVAADQLEQTRAHETQILARGLQTLNASIDQLSRRMDTVEQEKVAQAKADGAREKKQIADYIDSLPDPDNPDAPALYEPGGEMHTLSPTATDQGALPNELREGAPPELGTDPELDPAKLAYPQRPKYQQMPAISLASEDDC